MPVSTAAAVSSWHDAPAGVTAWPRKRLLESVELANARARECRAAPVAVAAFLAFVISLLSHTGAQSAYDVEAGLVAGFIAPALASPPVRSADVLPWLSSFLPSALAATSGTSAAAAANGWLLGGARISVWQAARATCNLPGVPGPELPAALAGSCVAAQPAAAVTAAGASASGASRITDILSFDAVGTVGSYMSSSQLQLFDFSSYGDAEAAAAQNLSSCFALLPAGVASPSAAADAAAADTAGGSVLQALPRTAQLAAARHVLLPASGGDASAALLSALQDAGWVTGGSDDSSGSSDSGGSGGGRAVRVEVEACFAVLRASTWARVRLAADIAPHTGAVRVSSAVDSIPQQLYMLGPDSASTAAGATAAAVVDATSYSLFLLGCDVFVALFTAYLIAHSCWQWGRRGLRWWRGSSGSSNSTTTTKLPLSAASHTHNNDGDLHSAASGGGLPRRLYASVAAAVSHAAAAGSWRSATWLAIDAAASLALVAMAVCWLACLRAVAAVSDAGAPLQLLLAAPGAVEGQSQSASGGGSWGEGSAGEAVLMTQGLLHAAIVWKQRYTNAGVAALILLSCRLLHAARLQPRLALFTRCLARAASDFLHFTVVFTLILVVYGVWGQAVFGRQYPGFTTVGSAAYSVIALCMYEYDSAALLAVAPAHARWYFGSFMFIATNLLLWQFLAILMETYAALRSELHSSYSHAPSLLEDMGSGLRSWWRWCRRWLPCCPRSSSRSSSSVPIAVHRLVHERMLQVLQQRAWKQAASLSAPSNEAAGAEDEDEGEGGGEVTAQALAPAFDATPADLTTLIHVYYMYSHKYVPARHDPLLIRLAACAAASAAASPNTAAATTAASGGATEAASVSSSDAVVQLQASPSSNGGSGDGTSSSGSSGGSSGTGAGARAGAGAGAGQATDAGQHEQYSRKPPPDFDIRAEVVALQSGSTGAGALPVPPAAHSSHGAR